MIFGKIDYINLLPLHIFLKKQPLCNSFKQSIAYKKSYPSKLNEKLKKRQIDAAFISSVASAQRGFKTINAGIVATKEVQSVLVKTGSYKQDPHSATSNLLAKILKVEGEVVIGDRALKLYLAHPQDYTDLAKLWYEKYNLPFVFARLSTNKHYNFYKCIGEKFANQKIFIPYYILNNYATQREIEAQDIKTYLKNLSYKIDAKANYSLKIFLRASRLFKATNQIKENMT
ncbi:MAG: menaquinone via futalosine step 1 [Campylobacteraceae bacterium]|nr:menaquinone via futalosine step 1 [Campylobacteraceae bacterium]